MFVEWINDWVNELGLCHLQLKDSCLEQYQTILKYSRTVSFCSCPTYLELCTQDHNENNRPPLYDIFNYKVFALGKFDKEIISGC